MSRKTVNGLFSIIIGVGLVAIGYIYFNFSTRPIIENRQDMISNGESNIFLYGQVVPEKSVDLEFENSGKIISIKKNVGDFVKAGTILAEQDMAEANVQLYKANAGVALAEANLKSTQSSLSREKYKLKSLKSSGASSNDREAQRAQIDSIEANVQAQQALLAVAKDNAKEVSLQLNKNILKAPFDGTIIRKNAEIGDLANPNVPNSSVLTMIAGNDVNALEINVFASQQDITKIKIGSDAKVTLDSYGPGTEFLAKISAIDPTETMKNGSAVYKVTLLFDQDDERIKSGVNVSVSIK